MKRSLLLALLVFLCLANQALAGDFQFTPRISTGLTYTDNVTETHGGHPDMIFTITPGANLEYESARVNLNADWSYTDTKYLAGHKNDEYHHTLIADGLWNVDGDYMYVKANDTFSSVYTDATRGEVHEGETSYSNRVDRNSFTVSPYIDTEPTERTTLRTGYVYTRTDYTGQGTDKENHDFFGEFGYEFTAKFRVEFTADYIIQDPAEGNGFRQFKYDVGPRYTFADNSYIYGRIGMKHTDMEQANNTRAMTWVAGWVHDLGHSVYSVETSKDEVEDPTSGTNLDRTYVSGSITKKFDRTEVKASLSYSEYEQLQARSKSVWRPGLTVDHLLTPRMSLYASLGYDISRTTALERSENLYLLGRVTYQLSDTSSVSLTYNYKNADTSGSSNDCYYRNSIGVSLNLSY